MSPTRITTPTQSDSTEVDYDALAQAFGTPLYVYDGALVRRQMDLLKGSFSKVTPKIWYAMKANFNPRLIQLLAREGAGIDAVSPGDVFLALECGVPKESILFTANNITDEEMELVQGTGVLFNVGSLSRLQKFAKANRGGEVCLRFNPAVVAGGHKHIMTGGDLTKFGILLEDCDRALEICEEYDLKVVGVHKHTGSGITSPGPFIQAMRNLLDIVTPKKFPDLKFVDIGGGYYVDYKPEGQDLDFSTFAPRVEKELLAFFSRYGRTLEVVMEPGKFLIAEAGSLLTTVNTIKCNNGRTIVGTDSGFSQLIRPLLYEAYHHISNVSQPDGDTQAYDICGNICETGDRFAEQREVSEINEGDILRVHHAGAYCFSMASHYNVRPLPAEVIIDKGEAVLVRPRLSHQELAQRIWQECLQES